MVALPLLEDGDMGAHARPLELRRHGHFSRLYPLCVAVVGQCHRHALHDAVLCSCRLFRSVRDRHRPCVPVLAADQGTEFFPGAVLHSADGHAAWRRLRDADDRRCHQGAVRAHPRCAGPSGLGVVGKPVVGAFCDDDLRFLAMDTVHLHLHAGGAGKCAA